MKFNKFIISGAEFRHDETPPELPPARMVLTENMMPVLLMNYSILENTDKISYDQALIDGPYLSKKEYYDKYKKSLSEREVEELFCEQFIEAYPDKFNKWDEVFPYMVSTSFLKKHQDKINWSHEISSTYYSNIDRPIPLWIVNKETSLEIERNLKIKKRRMFWKCSQEDKHCTYDVSCDRCSEYGPKQQ